MTIIDDNVIAMLRPDGFTVDERVVTLEINGFQFNVTCDSSITAEDFVAGNEAYILSQYMDIIKQLGDAAPIRIFDTSIQAPDLIVTKPVVSDDPAAVRQQVVDELLKEQLSVSLLSTAVGKLIEDIYDRIGVLTP